MGILSIATAFKLLHDKLDGFMPHFIRPNPIMHIGRALEP